MSNFWTNQDQEIQEKYVEALQIVGALSHLFSDSTTPYLYYRAHENLFCEVFNAKNLSRGDVSYDAIKDNIGIGLKTFLNQNGKTFQKVAEFNSDSDLFRDLLGRPEDLIHRVAELRNKRLEITKNATNADEQIYHLITREQGKMNVVETNMDLVDINSISISKGKSKNTINFTDRYNEYSFSLSKSTLSKRFDTTSTNNISTFNVQIHPNPLQLLSGLNLNRLFVKPTDPEHEFIILPLYSERSGEVKLRSGLNQWNASGRVRDIDEVYIPIPSWIHNKFEHFFEYSSMKELSAKNSPSFDVELPNGEIMKCKVAQSGGKALMSDPNRALGKWILRDVLKLKPRTIVTMSLLKEIGIDSIKLTKINQLSENRGIMRSTSLYIYKLDFMDTGSFEEFSLTNK